MKRTTKYVPREINESLGSLGILRTRRNRVRRRFINESHSLMDTRNIRKPAGSSLFEAVKSDTIVTAENIESVIRKIKKLTGCRVCLKGDNLVRCEDEKVIVRRVLNGKRTVDAVVELVEAYLEKTEIRECGRAIRESVAERFATYRHLYESEDEEEEEEGEENKADDKDEKKDIPMTAVVLTVKNGDGIKLKDELVDAGIPEDDIDVIDGEDGDDDKVKVDANSIFELKDFLKEKKDIDLEEKLGGEIVDDAEPEDKGGDDSGDKDDDNDLDFGDADFDALFGADDDSADDK